MRECVLLIEPNDLVAELLVNVLEVLDYESDVLTSGRVQESDLRAKHYRCVLIDLDQNSVGWRNKGLRLAEMATRSGLPVVMIPDHEMAITEIEGNGWLHFDKPFTLANVERVLLAAKRQPAK
jgi:DNA-binding response OmpR family regulator